jgi:DNA modification methylase
MDLSIADAEEACCQASNSFEGDMVYGISEAIDGHLREFFDVYRNSGEPIQVDFRKLVSWVPYSDSYTHYIHQYPAKLLKHIPIFFLNSKILLPESKSLVLDPFCGSGTVLLESILAGHNSIGCDANPIARLIARVKTTPLSPDALRPLIYNVINRAKQLRKAVPKNIVNVDHWFPAHVQRDLGRLYRAIDEIGELEQKEFYKIVFSSIVKKSSYADPYLSVPVRLKPEKYKNEVHRYKAEQILLEVDDLNVFDLFEKHSINSINRIDKLYRENLDVRAKIIGSDARCIGDESKGVQPDASVDLIVTSPPYAGAQKYIRSSSLSLGWLDYCEENTLRFYEKKNIGREHYNVSEYGKLITLGIDEIDSMLDKVWEINPLRAHISGNYLKEMSDALVDMYRVLKKNRYCVLVIGNNEVCGMEFKTQKYIRLICEKIGFVTCLTLVDDIQSRGLMTKRNKTAGIINSEWILVFEK